MMANSLVQPTEHHAPPPHQESAGRYSGMSGGRQLLVSLGSVSLAVILQQVLLGSHYQTNDDFAHALVLSGSLPGTAPDEHLLTPNVLLSLVLKFLYQSVESVPWYFLFLVAVQWLSGVVLQFVLLKRWDGWRAIAGYWIFFTCAQAYMLTYLQFTSTAIFAGGCAALLVLHYVQLSASIPCAAMITSSALILSSALLRHQSCLLALLLSAGYLLAGQSDGRKKRLAAGATVLAAAASFGLHSFNESYFNNNTEWSKFFSARTSLLKLIDFEGIDSAPDSPVLRAGRWSVNDGAMLKNFLYCDAELFSAERIIAAAKAAPPLRQDASWQYISHELTALLKDTSLWSLGLLCTAALFIPAKVRTMSRRRFALLALAVLAFLTFVMLSMKLPSRVYFPCIALLCSYALISICKPEVGPQLDHSNRVKSLFITSLICLSISSAIFLQYYTLIRPARHLRQLEQRMALCLEQIRERPGVYVVLGNAFPYEFLSPRTDLQAVMEGVYLLPTGGYNNSPWFETCKHNLGFKRSVLQELDKAGVFLISNDYFNTFLVEYFKERQAKDIHLIPVDEFKDVNVRIYAARSKRM